jgi:hypothetical protein
LSNLPDQRCFRFSLRTLFAVTTVCAIWLGWQLSIVRERAALSRLAQEQGALVHLKRPGDPNPASIPLGRALLGDVTVQCINVPTGTITEAEFDRLCGKFPEAIVFRVGTSKTGVFHHGPLNPPIGRQQP